MEALARIRVSGGERWGPDRTWEVENDYLSFQRCVKTIRQQQPSVSVNRQQDPDSLLYSKKTFFTVQAFSDLHKLSKTTEEFEHFSIPLLKPD